MGLGSGLFALILIGIFSLGFCCCSVALPHPRHRPPCSAGRALYCVGFWLPLITVVILFGAPRDPKMIPVGEQAPMLSDEFDWLAPWRVLFTLILALGAVIGCIGTLVATLVEKNNAKRIDDVAPCPD